MKRTSCHEGVPSTSVHVQAVGSCANAEFLKARLNSIRDATRSCSSAKVGGVPSQILHQVGRVTEVTVPADLGLGVHPRHPLPDADPEGPVSSVGVVPRVSTAPPKDSVQSRIIMTSFRKLRRSRGISFVRSSSMLPVASA